MEKTLRLTQIAACVLFILLVISLGFLLKAHADLKEAQTVQSLSVAQDRIREDCSGTTKEQKAACMTDLQALSDTLSQYTKSLGTPGAGTVSPQ